VTNCNPVIHLTKEKKTPLTTLLKINNLYGITEAPKLQEDIDASGKFKSLAG
jgi:hypothetical protein